MEKAQEFTINYWGKEFDYTNTPKERKSIKGKIKIIFLFLAVLIITPSLLLNLDKIKFEIKKPAVKHASIAAPVKINQIATVNNDIAGIVDKNDNYWKISKRYCGTGNFYLSIQERNNFKPLYEGDSITVICR